MKVVINNCFGGFSVSEEGARRIAELKGLPHVPERYGASGYDRNDPALVQAVEELGPAANGAHAKLAVVEIPDDVSWEIDEYDGAEHVAETHRTWHAG
jgi:hypothetical protein